MEHRLDTISSNFRFEQKKLLLKNLFILIHIFTSIELYAQNKHLRFVSDIDIYTFFKPQSLVTDSAQAFSEAQQLLNNMHAAGYLTATIDSAKIQKDSISFYLNSGRVYKWAQLSNVNINEEVLSKVGYRDDIYFNEPFLPIQFSNLVEKLLTFYENNGYPFAQIKLDSLEIIDNGIRAGLVVQKNNLLKIDSVLIQGESGIKNQYIYNYIGIKPGDVYNHLLIKKVSDRIREIPFLQEEKPFEVRYFENKTKLVLFLSKQKASRFNGILGVLTNEDNGRITITGDVDLNLINAFNRGENIRFNWRSLQENTQDLEFNFSYPYLMNTPLGFDFDFKLYKKDTSFIDINTIVGLRYILKRNDYFKVFLQNKNSSLLSKQSLATQFLTSLPPIADSKVRLYGIEYNIERLNYRYNPSKGFASLLNFAVGKRQIKKIPELEEESPRIYENLNLNSNQYNGFFNTQYFLSLAQRSTILFANKSALTYSENLFENELLRIGGLKTLRGFDEESIFASMYSIFTLEYRFLLDRNSFFSLFTDAAYYEKDSEAEFIRDTPMGFGAGVSFETGAGIFTLNYALGKQFDNPVFFRAAKIHFGFINFF